MTTGKDYRLIVKIGGTMAAVSVLSVLLACVLNLLRFEDTYKSLVAERLDVAAQEIGRAIQVGIDFGLPIEAQDNLPNTLHQYVASHRDIRSIVIYACDGQPILREGRSDGIGEPWRDHLGKASWFSVRDKGLSVGLSIADPTGRCAAGVASARFRQRLSCRRGDDRRSFSLCRCRGERRRRRGDGRRGVPLGRARTTLNQADQDLTPI